MKKENSLEMILWGFSSVKKEPHHSVTLNIKGGSGTALDQAELVPPPNPICCCVTSATPSATTSFSLRTNPNLQTGDNPHLSGPQDSVLVLCEKHEAVHSRSLMRNEELLLGI